MDWGWKHRVKANNECKFWKGCEGNEWEQERQSTSIEIEWPGLSEETKFMLRPEGVWKEELCVQSSEGGESLTCS